jgi:hypothetical protein
MKTTGAVTTYARSVCAGVGTARAGSASFDLTGA